MFSEGSDCLRRGISPVVDQGDPFGCPQPIKGRNGRLRVPLRIFKEELYVSEEIRLLLLGHLDSVPRGDSVFGERPRERRDDPNANRCWVSDNRGRENKRENEEREESFHFPPVAFALSNIPENGKAPEDRGSEKPILALIVQKYSLNLVLFCTISAKMLLQQGPILEDLLVSILARKPNLSVKQLSGELLASGKRFSERGIYKELSKLESREIVVKTKQTFSLQLPWIINVLAFADAAYEIYASPKYLAQLIQTSSGTLHHKFSSLRKLDLYWIQSMMALHKLYPGKSMCLWIPHQWFHLAHDAAIQQFYSALDITGEKRFHIIGVDCYLSRLAISHLPKHGHYAFGVNPLESPLNIYYSFIGNHLITVTIDKNMERRIQDLFLRVRRAEEMDALEIASVLKSRVKATLSIEENEAKVRKLRRRFEDAFRCSID